MRFYRFGFTLEQGDLEQLKKQLLSILVMALISLIVAVATFYGLNVGVPSGDGEIGARAVGAGGAGYRCGAGSAPCLTIGYGRSVVGYSTSSSTPSFVLNANTGGITTTGSIATTGGITTTGGIATTGGITTAGGITTTGNIAVSGRAVFGQDTVASGYSSVAFGRQTFAGGDYSSAFGYQNSALGDGSISFGYQTTASGDFSAAFGYEARAVGQNSASFGNAGSADFSNSVVVGGGYFQSVGDAQVGQYVARIETTNATTTTLLFDGDRFVIPSGKTVAFDVLVVGRSSGGLSAAYRVTGLVKRVGGTVSLVGTPSVTVIAEDDSAWNCVVGVDGANYALAVRVVGAAGVTVRWVANIRTAEVSY